MGGSPGELVMKLFSNFFRHFTYVTIHSPTIASLYLRHSSFSNPSLLHIHHSSFSNPSFASPTSQALHLASRPRKNNSTKLAKASGIGLPNSTIPLKPWGILQICEKTQSSFSNLSVTSPMSQLILQPFCHFTYVTAHSTTIPLLYLRHSSFSNPSSASPTSQALHLIHLACHPCLQPKCP